MFGNQKCEVCIFSLLGSIFITVSVGCYNTIGVFVYNDAVRVHAEGSDIVFEFLSSVNNLTLIKFICKMGKDYSRKLYTYTQVHAVGFGRNIQFLTDLFHMSGLFSMTDDQAVRALIKGFFEMTVGCEAVAEGISVTSSVKCVLCAFILSWGGLSVMGQSMSMLSGTGVTLGYLMVSKLTHGIFAAAAAFLITLFVL